MRRKRSKHVDVYLFTARRPQALTVTAGGRQRGVWGMGGDRSFDDCALFLVQISACDVGSRQHLPPLTRFQPKCAKPIYFSHLLKAPRSDLCCWWWTPLVS